MATHEIEYAGFKYLVEETPTGPVVLVVRGQHPAANKEKHRRAAMEQYMEKFVKRSK